jgi:DivIVA domain-containing protein
VSSSTRLTPEEIVNRGFANAFRGISETEVRNFLKRVADEFASLRDRERDLTARVEQLEDRLRNPPPPTEQQLLDSLGEETARVLRSAQEAADDIRRKADERAAELLTESEGEAQRLRETTEAQCGQLRREAEEAIAARESEVEVALTELRAEAERETGARREEASREADTARETARAEGREMVAQARAVRERVLGDLQRRRELLQAQLEALRAGRERLLEAYRVVRRTLVEAAEALSGAESPGTESPGTESSGTESSDAGAGLQAGVPRGLAADVAAAGAAVDAAVFEAVARTEESPASADEAAEVSESVTLAATEPEPVDGANGGRDVDALFARLRGATPDTPPAGQPEAVDAARDTAAVTANGKGDATPPESEAAEPTGDAAVVHERDVALERLHRELVRKVKRRVQDEQNELLDELRQHPGAAAPDKVLATLDDQLAGWTAVMRPALDEAATAAARSVSGTDMKQSAPDGLVDELVRSRALPLRERVYDALLDDGDDDITQRINSRYREWKAGVESAVGDALVAAWGRGTVDVAPAGSLLRWIPEHEGRCADCDDNALEPTARGEPFPTGQAHPPAHPGCRCVLTVAVEAGISASGGLHTSGS